MREETNMGIRVKFYMKLSDEVDKNCNYFVPPPTRNSWEAVREAENSFDASPSEETFEAWVKATKALDKERMKYIKSCQKISDKVIEDLRTELFGQATKREAP